MSQQDYAIIVGINDYRGLRPLRSAHQDATRFYEWLIDPDGGAVPADHVRILLSPDPMPVDPFDGTPVQRDIDRALRDFGVEGGGRVGRRLYFYFAGHGVGPTFDEVAMLMADAAMQRLNSNIGLRGYLSYFKNTGVFDELVYIVDCCRDRVLTARGADPVFTFEPANPLPRVADFVVLAAAYGEKAFDPAVTTGGERRGILTTAVMEALGGDPRAADAQGRVTSSSLRQYVLERVPQLAAGAQLDQTPEVPRIPHPDFVFVQRDPRPVRVRIVAGPGVEGDLVVHDGADMREVARRAASDARGAAPPWELDLVRNSRYMVVNAASGDQVLDTNGMNDGDVFHFGSHA
ncbi:MAG TPA: caspase family protein [Longimicrobiaceae bacterium]|nr:caspase family protein [Longimicrobiaceae bacterium]